LKSLIYLQPKIKRSKMEFSIHWCVSDEILSGENTISSFETSKRRNIHKD